jgi:hypothetical protein
MSKPLSQIDVLYALIGQTLYGLSSFGGACVADNQYFPIPLRLPLNRP